MASIILNGAKIELTVQKQETLGALANTLVPMLAAKQSLLASLGAVLAHGLAKPIAPTDPPMQACLWLLHEMGIRAMTANAGSGGGSVDKVTTEAERACDTSDPYSAGNMATGRAMAAALSNVSMRTFTLNGTQRPVKIIPRDKIEPAMQAIVDMRRLNEPIHVTTTRALASMVASGTALDDERIDAVISLLSDLGITGLSIDVTATTITLEGLFSEANAVASAYLQGGGLQGIQKTRERITQLNTHARNVAAGSVEFAKAAPAPMRHVAKARRR
ncbi:MAG: hypothetical protein EXS17_03360 [Phycisphaerales bacterium]|nr:hypothetical protein [Phycisphaerales bacterium]